MTNTATQYAWRLRVLAPCFAAIFVLSACTNVTPGPQAIETVLEPTDAEVQAALGEDELTDGATEAPLIGTDENAAEAVIAVTQAPVAIDGIAGAETANSPTPLALVPVQPARRNPLAAFLRGNEAGNSASKRQFGTANERSSGFGLAAPQTSRTTRTNITRNRIAGFSANALPGVNARRALEIDEAGTGNVIGSRKRLRINGNDPLRLASVTNLARRGTHGLLLQRPDVKVHCFPRSLLSLLKQVERRFGSTPVVTSGYRSPSYNRRIRGARNSHHTLCKAADIQVKGVSKWTLARYLRSLPGRGGVGTYCHTKSVHIDVGSKRDWNRKCRRRSKRRA